MMRPLIRLLATLLALALAGAGALLALEVVWQWVFPANAPLVVPWPDWRDALSQLTWSAAPVLSTTITVAVVGLVVLLLTLLARPHAVRLNGPVEQVSVSTSPGSLARLIGRHVRAHESVSDARVTATRRRVRVRARSKLESEHQLRPRLYASVTEVLEEMPLRKRPKLTVVVKAPRSPS